MNETEERNRQRSEMWRKQVLPKFVEAGLGDAQTDAAKKMFYAGFEAGWDSHRAALMKEFIQENQKQKVNLA
jgi:hypothetical protein